MTLPRAHVVCVLLLSLACVRTDASGSANPEPAASQPPPAPPAPAEDASAARVCEHVWALMSAESASTGEPVGGFERYMNACVANVEEERLAISEDAYQREVACMLAAADMAELQACDPDSGPPPSPREPARFPEGVEARPLSEVMEHAVYTPDPDKKRLQETKAARFDKADGASVVAFCVETRGGTSDIHTVQKFPGDPLIDQIIRDTVARWRFKPFIVDGVAVKVCTEKQFMLRFR
ncbi:MAG: hypothetical protein R6X02_04000 [Enhygromyxa sp.]